MTLLNVTDANTGEIVAVDTENPSGSLYVVDANTGNRVSIDLSSPSGSINVIDADTGNIISLDLANLTGIITVVDANTGDFFDVDLDNPSGLFYTRDENTGDLVQIDLSVDTFFKSGSLVIPQLGEKIAPTLAITLSQYTFKIGDTATVIFTFSEEVINFTTANITSPNGSLSSFGITGNPLIYTATFTPTNGVTDTTNVITVDTNWADLAGNHPTNSTNSSNYTVDTTAPTCVITCTQTSPTSAALLNFTFTFSETVTGFEIADITVSNGSASNFAGSGTVYTCDVTPTAAGNVTVDVVKGVCQDDAGNTNTAATQFVIQSGLDNFTRANGAIGGGWSGATWTISGNTVLNTPTGTEKITDGGMDAWNSATDLTSWTETTTGGSVNQEASDKHGGNYAARFDFTTTSLIRIAQTPSGIVAGDWVQLSVWAKSSINGKSISSNIASALPQASSIFTLTTSYVQKYFAARATSSNPAINFARSTVTAGQSLYFDDASFLLLSLSTLFATLPACGETDVTAQVVVTVDPLGVEAGLVLNLDNASSPSNFIIAYLIDNGAGTVCNLDKCVNGAYSNVITGAVTFGATKNLKVIRDGNNYSLWYGTTGSETQVGATTEVTGITGTINGLFSTAPVPQFDAYKLDATGGAGFFS